MTTQTSPASLPAPVGRMMLRNVRLCFAQDAVTAKAPDAEKPAVLKYGAHVLLPPDHPQIPEIHAKIAAAAAAKWKDPKVAALKLAQAKATDKLPLHDGNLKANWAGHAGHLYFKAVADEADTPTWLGGPTGKTPLAWGDAKKVFYGGCYVNVSVEIFAYDNKSTGFTAQFRGIQFLRDGDSFGGGSPASADEFDEVAGSEAGDFA